MKTPRAFLRRLRALGQRRATKREIDEELRFHLEQRTAANIAAGMSPEEAALNASRRFGNLQKVREECRELRGASLGETFLQDVRFGLRQLRRNPAFSAVAVVTLALGIGANTAIFSVVNAILLKPLPYRNPGRIVMLWTDNASANLGFHELPPAPPDLLHWRKDAASFEQITAFRSRQADLSGEGDLERVGGVQVTANFFSLLGVAPFLGRAFSTDEEQPGNDKVVVISHGLWQRRFGGDTNLAGKFITVNRQRRAVIGVMPSGFHFPRGAEMPAAYDLLPQTDVWQPLAEDSRYWQDDDHRDFIAMGRLRQGISTAAADAEIRTISERLAAEYPLTHAGWTTHLRPLAMQVAGKTRPALLLLLGAVAFVLLIACANVANLLLCRSAVRRKEMAVRAAIGAGRGRIIRQLLTESVVLSSLGGAAGLVLGVGLIRMILAFSPPGIPRLDETVLDGRVLAFTLIISVGTGLIFGLAPSWQASGINLTEALAADSRYGAAAGWHRAHGFLVMAEVALAVILLAGAGLMAKSFMRLQTVDPGFNPNQVAAFDVSLFGGKYENSDRVRQFFRDARERLAKLPGVQSVAAISNLPLDGNETLDFLFVEGAPMPAPGERVPAENRKATPGYFHTMGVMLERGRDFTDQDTSDKPIVCIINETTARRFFPGVDPLGRRIRLGSGTPDEANNPYYTIVGVAGDVRGYALEVKAKPQVYLPLEQNTDNEMTFVIRAEQGRADSLERAIRAEMKAIDPTLPPANFRTMERLVADSVARPRFSAFLLGLFAAAALLLTMVGLYGVVAYAVGQRTREIGIRVALGAGKRDVFSLVVRQGMLPALVGLVIGLGGALALTRLLASQLYEVRPADPATFLAVSILLLLVALLACCLPAGRAARLDPAAALRCE
jgi:putative ABC transport system permease protein